MFAKDKKFSDKERWICVYPAYLNNKKTLGEGRKLAKSKCVDNPTAQEIRDVLAAAGLTIGVENKLYSREQNRDTTYRGRVRVQLFNDDHTAALANFPTRDSVLRYLGETIPKLKTRQQKSVGGGSDQSQSQQSSSKGGKSKGKKGKR
ncbi:signal recognition particle 19kDa [Chamberlinius hualienensis]